MNKGQLISFIGVSLVALITANKAYADPERGAFQHSQSAPTHLQLSLQQAHERPMDRGAHRVMVYDLTSEERPQLKDNPEAVDRGIFDLLQLNSQFLQTDYVEKKANTLLLQNADRVIVHSGYVSGFRQWAILTNPETQFTLQVLAPASVNSFQLFGFLGGGLTEVLEVLPAQNDSELTLHSGVGARWQTTDYLNLSIHSGYELRDARINGGNGAALHLDLSYEF
ncbi:MAG: hypothetical protein L0Y67_01180 [Gammaproteobacteria bacterium]|nr:hypothetical protein [Gammaproteobacteria bacterium]MCI0590217.1 hypothetical protein [Gammaproteobacteria bacterium]